MNSIRQIWIHKDFVAAHKAQKSSAGPTKVAHFDLPSDTRDVGGTHFGFPGKSSKLAYFSSLPTLDIDKTIEELQQRPSKR